ncbi:MAG: hypothetical protein E7261_03920 [Lachnospiraceae bacterium]|nr:hypothetical protein [Lachnospiraceae bacterium]
MDATIATDISVATTFTDDTFLIDELKSRIAYLESENKKLSDTVDWMHALIWDLYKKMRASSHSQA